jgi:hypothetical protein
MKTLSLYLILLSSMFLLSCGETAYSSPISQSTTAIRPSNYQQQLRTGMDVDWAKTSNGRYWAQKWHDKGVNVPKLFKARGLSHVRIRIKDDILDNTVFEETGKTLLEEIEVLVNDCLDANIIPILAYQAKPFKQNPTSDEALNHVVQWWKKVAETFKNKPYVLAYDIVIETTEKVKKHNDRLNLLYQKTADAIHNIDKKRILIIAPNKISNPYELDKLVIPTPSDYIMVEWHFYAAGPKKKHKTKQWTTGTDKEKKLITDRVDTAVKWSKANHIPTWVGAWMANNYNHSKHTGKTFDDGAPASGEYSVLEQVKIATFISNTLRKNNIPFAVNSDTKFFNRETNQWYPSMRPVLDAMIK